MTITTGNHPVGLWPGVHDFFGAKYDEKPEIWQQVFDINPSDKAFERVAEIKGFGLPLIKSEGTSVAFEDEFQGDISDFVHVVYALGYVVTEEEMQDNLYEQLGPARAGRLAFSMRQGKEIVHANHFNRAFNSSFTGPDGVELISTAHITDNGTQSNHIATAADLSEAALEDLTIQVRKATNSKGLTVAIQPQMVMVANEGEFEAHRILDSILQNDTANNAMNVLRSTGAFPGGILVNPYLTDPDAFFIKTNAPEGMTHFMRREKRFQRDNDFGTGNALAKADDRYSSGWSDWRGIFGSPGA